MRTTLPVSRFFFATFGTPFTQFNLHNNYLKTLRLQLLVPYPFLLFNYHRSCAYSIYKCYRSFTLQKNNLLKRNNHEIVYDRITLPSYYRPIQKRDARCPGNFFLDLLPYNKNSFTIRWLCGTPIWQQ